MSRLASHPPSGAGERLSYSHMVLAADQKHGMVVGAGRAMSRLASHPPSGGEAGTEHPSESRERLVPQFVPRESIRPEPEVKMTSILLPSATFQLFDENMPAERRKNGRDHGLCRLMFMKEPKQSNHASKARRRRRRRVSKPAPSVSKASPPSPGSGNFSNLSPITHTSVSSSFPHAPYLSSCRKKLSKSGNPVGHLTPPSHPRGDQKPPPTLLVPIPTKNSDDAIFPNSKGWSGLRNQKAAFFSNPKRLAEGKSWRSCKGVLRGGAGGNIHQEEGVQQGNSRGK